MNMSASQCSSSGCESGWTLYLDQSSLSKNQYQNFGGFVDGNEYARAENDDDDYEEEDLSMVSDASSGPPHYCEDDEDQYCYDSSKKNKNKQKCKEYRRSQQQQYSYLDDTASSPVLSKKAAGKNNEASVDHVLEFSQGFSATHFKGKYSLKKHFGFFQSEKSASKEPGGFQGRKWK
ncbi:protein SOB FIVE-LIKE 5 [Ricinus communis]|uniref:Uncharacterized protein n=1 Tax=Ricinus communis TaxID=3988 RepID=B9R6Y6_RICCO|nr:protein SOB FIVE-LIKE 5 [Ricinus communis]EEF52266.1 conserved hypothetical protein [Ricinus communis]|eukprot:XP_002510079.1 uncharacterized protein LOC8265281 [Ricinus communis]